MTVAPGWYPDPTTGQPRWWDGHRWTQHVHQPAGPPSRVGELAGFWQRVAAVLIDGAAVSVLSMVTSIPAQIGVQQDLQPIQRELERDLEAGRPGAFGDLMQATAQVYADHAVGLLVVPLVLAMAYHAAFLRWRGATPGKLALGIRVRRASEDGRLPWGTIAVRLAVQTLVPAVGYVLVFASGSVAAFVLGWLAISAYSLTDALLAARANRRAGHDVAAGTVVVRTR